MKKVLLLVVTFLVVEMQFGFASVKNPLDKQSTFLKGINPTQIKIGLNLKKEVKIFKLCQTNKVRSVTNCPSGSSGAGIITYTSMTFTSNADGSCGSPNIDNVIYSYTETISLCFSNQP